MSMRTTGTSLLQFSLRMTLAVVSWLGQRSKHLARQHQMERRGEEERRNAGSN
uniref:Uncharacterized protein n=1 Tax=Arundo donax TaxID=35708 RepID=A0A0A9G5M7_ARUDO